MKVVVAEGALLEEILDATFPVWNEGLSRHAYALWNAAQMRTPWGRERLQRFALVDGEGRLLATAKRYRFDIRVGGSVHGMCGVGALFTPPTRRRQGYAGELLERLLEEARREGAVVGALFSEIGPAFYRRHGFETVPLDEVSVTVKLRSGSPAMLVRAGDDRDLPALAAMHDVRSAPAPVALRRDPAMIHYALSKRRLFAGMNPSGRRQVEFFVAEEGASAVAYVILSVNAHGWIIEEAGDRDPAGARLGAMLQVLVAREPSRRVPGIRAWWPEAFPVPPQLELTGRKRVGDLLMMRPLAGVQVPARAGDVFYWHGDYF